MARGAIDVLIDFLQAPAGRTWIGFSRGQQRTFFVAHTLDFLAVGFDLSRRPDLTAPDPIVPGMNGQGR